MTDAQHEALSKAWEILCEHFDSCIVAYETEDTEDGEPLSNVFDCNYHGGVCDAIGLAERSKHQWLNLRGTDEDDPWKKKD